MQHNLLFRYAPMKARPHRPVDMMSRRFRAWPVFMVTIALVILQLAAHGQGPGTPFLRRPDIHGDQIVFTSEGDLWLGSVQNGTAQRITSHPGVETNAHFSPDGKSLAFTAQYDGGADVYVMPLGGGEPRRLTYDPSGARVIGWTPDGKNVLYRSRRNSGEGKNRLWRVPVAGGMPSLLPIPQVEHAAIHTNGHMFAYVPVSAEWQHWFRYRGGEADDIWLADTEAKTFKRLTTDPAVDTTPVWVGDTIYFVSERDGMANLYRLDPKTGKTAEVTHYTDYGILYPSSDGKRVVYQHGNGLALYDPTANKTQELKLALNSDRIHARMRRVPMQPAINSVAVGPTGKRILVEARGQLMSVPVENGDSRPVANSPGSRTQYPAWSRDGKQAAFVSDRSGEEQIWIAPAVGTGQPRQLTHDHQGPLGPLLWSPDGKYIATSDREMRIFLADAMTGEMILVDQADRGFTYDTILSDYSFSPDGKWLAFSRIEPNWNNAVYLYDIAARKKTAISTSEMNSYSPVFDPTGKYLVLLSDRQFDPIGSGPSRYFAFTKTTKVTLIPLAADTPSPFLLNDDEEGVPDSASAAKPVSPAATPSAPAAPGATKAPAGAAPVTDAQRLTPTKVDLNGIASRLVDIPLPVDRYARVAALDGRLLLLINADVDGQGNPAMPNQLIAFDLKKKTSTVLVNRLTDFQVSADGKKLLLQSGKSYAVVDAATGPVTPGTGAVNLAGITLTVDPETEWKQIFNESWRIARDFFYDPNLHGVDWQAVRTKYAALLPDVADRSDLNGILGDMIAELNTGHAYVGGGDMGEGTVRSQPMGYLGADLEPVRADPATKGSVDAFRITKILPGDEFDLEARSPLLTPGVNVRVGDYLLAVAGQPVQANQDVQALLIGTPGQVLTITVNSKPTLEGAREIRIKPMESEGKARYYDWVDSRREYVRTHGGANLGYVHIPNMGGGGLTEFTKHYYPNLAKDGMIYDVRNNGGGNISSELLLQMASKPFAYFKPRYGASWTRQDWGFSGYSVALCNENSGSNAEEFCDAFQRLKLGPVIGVRTWGGEVGSGGGYPLIDGGAIFIPNYGEWAPDGKWLIEGTGAQPDIPVENDPASLLAGRDPQLDRAIAVLKEEIARHPIVRPTPPAFPNKAYRPGHAVSRVTSQR
jgi:tricorn protease